MSTLSYNTLALDWRLPGQSDGGFQKLALAILVLVLVIAVLLSSIPVPESQHRERAVLPDRVARFVAERPTPPKPIPEPPPRAATPPPPPVETASPIQRERRSEVESRPLTEAQKNARERAQSTGLLALQNELASLMDTGDLAALVAGETNQAAVSGAESRASHDINVITAQSTQGGGKVTREGYGSQVGDTRLEQRDIASVRSELFDSAEQDEERFDRSIASGEAGQGTAQARSREDVTVIFDQNKGALYSLYARERRRSPNLEGRIVLRITIAPSGEVTDVQVVSSELNSPSLESGIIGRIKMFRFEAMDVDEMTVTYPIEFLPS